MMKEELKPFVKKKKSIFIVSICFDELLLFALTEQLFLEKLHCVFSVPGLLLCDNMLSTFSGRSLHLHPAGVLTAADVARCVSDSKTGPKQKRHPRDG